MANISKLTLPNNITYNIKDTVSEFGGTNLFRLTPMNDRSKFIGNSSTDWTAYFRWYNSSANIHTFEKIAGEEYQDTILLNSAANLGICFAGTPTDLGLDLNSYYTMSCEAKCSATGYNIALGLSYYNTSNTWVWRGGSNTRAFTAADAWQKFSLTFKPDTDTQAICYCFTVLGKSSGTDTWTIKHCKLERGNKVTDWAPAPQDLVKVSGTQLQFY